MSTEQMMTVVAMETAKPPVGAYTLPAGYLDLASNSLWQDVELREIRRPGPTDHRNRSCRRRGV
jgi:hypothetical protein